MSNLQWLHPGINYEEILDMVEFYIQVLDECNEEEAENIIKSWAEHVIYGPGGMQFLVNSTDVAALLLNTSLEMGQIRALLDTFAEVRTGAAEALQDRIIGGQIISGIVLAVMIRGTVYALSARKLSNNFLMMLPIYIKIMVSIQCGEGWRVSVPRELNKV